MKDGKKSIAESILYDAMGIIEKKANEPALKIFEQALENAKPMIEVKSRRVGGSVITSYSIHYTKLYEARQHFMTAVPENPLRKRLLLGQCMC